jgi:hypothetical protein
MPIVFFESKIRNFQQLLLNYCQQGTVDETFENKVGWVHKIMNKIIQTVVFVFILSAALT